MAFSAKLPFYQGPADLLLYLVRKQELDILDIPLTQILEQYAAYMPNIFPKTAEWESLGDGLVLFSTLIEIKSHAALPNEKPIAEEVEVPKQELVKQLLEYKQYCDAARLLQIKGERWQLHFPRLADDLPQRLRDLTEEPIQEIEIWDLVSAFDRILREHTPQVQHTVVYDDTPISAHMNRIHQRLRRESRIAFRQLLMPGQHKSTLVGLFLASLELVRHEFANVYQEINFGEIELAIRQGNKPLDFASLGMTC